MTEWSSVAYIVLAENVDRGQVECLPMFGIGIQRFHVYSGIHVQGSSKSGYLSMKGQASFFTCFIFMIFLGMAFDGI